MERLLQVPTLLHTPNCSPASCQCLALAKYGYMPAMLRVAEIIIDRAPLPTASSPVMTGCGVINLLSRKYAHLTWHQHVLLISGSDI